MASPTGLHGLLLLAVSGLLLLVGTSSGEHQWNAEHRALWAANARGVVESDGVLRGPAKRHAGPAAPGGGPRASWVPGSKMALHHYPDDRRGLRPGAQADDALQYMEGADTEVALRRVPAPASSQHLPPDQRAASGRRGAGGAPRSGGHRRQQQGEGRRTRHHKQQQPQGQQQQQHLAGATASSSSSSSWAPRTPVGGNVTTVLRTVQRGSAVVPLTPGSSSVPVVPVHMDPSKTQRTLVQVTLPPWSRGAVAVSTSRPPAAYAPAYAPAPAPANLVAAQDSPYPPPHSAPFHYQGPSINSRADYGRAAAAPLRAVPECPADRSVLAPKEQDYVLMERITARDGTPLDVIAGPQAGDPVSEGPHPVVGRLVLADRQASPRTRQSAPLCRLTYTVIVRRCGPAPLLTAPADSAPRAPRCIAGTAWGSRCHYRCPRRDLVLRGDKWVVCGDDLRWHGRAPVCTERPGKGRLAAGAAPTPPPRRSCAVPALPEHGHLSCRARDDAEEANDAQRMAEGSECTVSCRPPHRLQADGAQSVVTRCSAGRWNVTSWTCVRAEALDADLDGDISAVLSDAGAALSDDWDWKSNSLTDPCSPNPCHSGGTCLRGPPQARALCQCRPGTEGDWCERVLCRGSCLHGGRCVLLRGQPSCFCRRGFAGSRCQAPVKSVRYPAPTPAPTPLLAVLASPALTTPTTTTTTSAVNATAPQHSADAANG